MARVSPAERRALFTLLGLGVGGHLLRAGDPADAPPGDALAGLIAPDGPGDPLAHRDSSIVLSRPLAAGERIDVDRAGVAELQRLPGVGPALARRIVADREKGGAFGGIQGRDRVPGIGPATLSKLEAHLTFSGVSSEASAVGGSARIDLNRATEAELRRIPGIGAVRARAIVAFRDSAGPFREESDLSRVGGLPSELIGRLGALLHPP